MSGGVKAPPDKVAEQLRVHEHEAERNANVRFTMNLRHQYSKHSGKPENYRGNKKEV